MCGIAGFIGNRDGNTSCVVNGMLNVMRSRGPDFQKVYALEGAYLGAARLRITDHLNTEADMPFYNKQSAHIIVFNGEVYNHLELRQYLDSYNFKTSCDTETVLAAYLKWGQDCLKYIKGMFSFCIYNEKDQVAFIAVDPTGQKPLYYMKVQGGLFFASDIEALIQIPEVEREWDVNAISQMIGIMFIFGRDTHIKQIKKLESGCSITWSYRNNNFNIDRYYTVPVRQYAELSISDQKNLKQSLYEAVEASCYRLFNLEVPYAHLLSGGIDSTTVVAFAKKKGLTLSTYSIGLVDPDNSNDISYNEFKYARYVANVMRTKHTEIALTPEDYCKNLKKWSEVCSEPHGAPEAASLYNLFSVISDKNYRVAFSGNGPDEIFDGYGHGHLLKDTPVDNLVSSYFKKFNGLNNIDLERLMPDLTPEQNFCASMQPIIDLYKNDCSDPAQLACLMNFHGIYPVCEFKQMDQASMAHSVEVRSPLAELDIVEMAFQVPSKYKHFNGCEKWIFKEALKGVVPEKIINRKKAGFPISNTIYKTEAFGKLIEHIFEEESGLNQLGFINMSYLKELWQNGTSTQCSIFYRLYILNEIIERQADYLR